MVVPREEGGVGICDFQKVHDASLIDRRYRLWNGEGLWASWIHKRYVKDSSLQELSHRYNASTGWRAMLKTREATAK